MIQDQTDPMTLQQVGSTSRYFRIAAFAMHLGLSMLEAHGASALIATGTKIWHDVGRRGRKNWAFQGDLTKTPDAMGPYTSSYLRKLRASSPTIIISDRLVGDGATVRLAWGSSADVYNAKQAVLFQLNKSVSALDNINLSAFRISRSTDTVIYDSFLTA